MTLTDIVVQGASEHNLRSVDVTIPRLRLTTITGVSGSGKSSLAFDTIYQEGQRRYVESLSAYARQFLGKLEKPKVERIDGLSPTLLIDQRGAGSNPRSTIGTITEIWDHLRLLYARLGEPHCPVCDAPVTGQTADAIVGAILAAWPASRISVLAPLVRDRKGEHRQELEGHRLKGLTRAWIDGIEHRLDALPRLQKNRRHTIELVVDRLRGDVEKRDRLAESVETALELAEGFVSVRPEVGEPRTFSVHNACPEGHGDLPELEPRLFSFNSPHGACPACEGLGERRQPDPDLLVADASKSLRQGCLRIQNASGYMSYVRLGPKSLAALARAFEIDLDLPWKALPARARKVLLHGSGAREVTLEWDWTSADAAVSIRGQDRRPFEGILPALTRALELPGQGHVERYFSVARCPDCGGSRLGPVARAVRFRGRRLHELARLSVSQAAAWVGGLELAGREAAIGRQILKEVAGRLRFLEQVGVGYLELDRSAATLSGGESQRVRLATQVGSGLQGVLYVLDEPSVGLHPRDNRRLIETLHELRDRGNTVLVVEHDEETIRSSDVLIDIGPGAGRHGGQVLAAGPIDEVLAGPATPTTDYLTGRRRIEIPRERRAGRGEELVVVGATQHNLADLTVAIPLGCLVAVTGVSGSGKSTLVHHVLERVLARHLHGAQAVPGAHREVRGLAFVDKVVEIDQQPIGRTPRSNPATYTGAMDLIRDVYAATTEAKVRGFGKGRFSFNVRGGRCEACEGAGVNVVEMQFLPDVEVVCDVCQGRRYNAETLQVQYRGLAIDQILAMTAEEALAFFEHHARLARILRTMVDVGLGYLPLGQPSTTISGGEAQRMKLASELCRPATGRTFYILDEPTTGLHFEDVRVLIAVLQRLVDAGNTVLVVEHNLDVVKCADRVLDLGPEGGAGGGRLVAQGTPEEIARVPESHTGRALAPLLDPRRGHRRRHGASRTPESAAPVEQDLVVRGARLHNLRGVDVTVPHGSLTVFTGPSGSGKTSLAFDTIFAEGQRRYVESLSTYARRFLERLDRPPVDSISGLAPAIAIDQRTAVRNPRSTVATSTEIHDGLRLLFARVGQPHCWTCGKPLRSWTPSTAAQDLVERLPGERVLVTASLWSRDHSHPTVLTDPSALPALAEELGKDGFVRLLVDGVEARLDAPPEVVEARSIELVIDRLRVEPERRARLAEALHTAQQRGLGLAHVRREGGELLDYEARVGCARCGNWLGGELTPRSFSFNSHAGACPSCQGLGRLMTASATRLVDRPDLPLFGGALGSRVGRFVLRDGSFPARVLRELAERDGVDLGRPWRALPERFRRLALHGAEGRVAVSYERRTAERSRAYEVKVEWEGLLPLVERWWREAGPDGWWSAALESLLAVEACPACAGGRLQPSALAVRIGERNIAELCALTVDEAHAALTGLVLGQSARVVAADLLKDLLDRLRFLRDVGLGYLTLDRASSTLSGGEAQRIRLANQLGHRLVGVLYVLDEPSIGLHPRDQRRLLDTLRELRDLGNTVLVVEHDRDTIEAADHVVDLGPGAGREGGRVIAAGPPAALAAEPASLTGQYLARRLRVSLPATRRPGRGRAVLEGCRLHNLCELDVSFPIGALTVVTGVSGSGKSSLVLGLLVPAVRARLEPGQRAPEGLGRLCGGETWERLLVVDQSPLGRAGHSNAATYVGFFDDVRALFAGTPEARLRGFTPGRFSTQVAGGRCEACEGRGVEIVEMHFLSDVELPCEACGGRRFNAATLQVRWKNLSIADVLELDVRGALEVFAAQPAIVRRLRLLDDVGLGYLALGQPAATLSGGEAQRVKLAAELGRPGSARSLIVLDEPTTGLHFEDVGRLVGVLQALVEQGATVVLVEHNVDVIKNADWVLDLGPEGGEGGGRLVVAGTPEAVVACKASHTGRALLAELPRPAARRKVRA